MNTWWIHQSVGNSFDYDKKFNDGVYDHPSHVLNAADDQYLYRDESHDHVHHENHAHDRKDASQ
ncbi:MAG: hypothetical protein GXO74_00760 [Calditrichaeota bacterium]|nr:hypothetical protein [Calditrichota bacterium]